MRLKWYGKKFKCYVIHGVDNMGTHISIQATSDNRAKCITRLTTQYCKSCYALTNIWLELC